MTLENDIRMDRLDKTKEAATKVNESLDWPNLIKFRKENDEIRKTGLKVKIVFMGDSITEGWSLSDPNFFKKNSFVNRGIGGQTSPQMLLRFKQDAIHLNPNMVVINAGTNDIAENTGPSNQEMIIDNITSMAEICIKNNIDVALSTILPVFKYSWNENIINVPEKISSINKILKKYSENNNIQFIDYYSSMVDGQKGLMSAY
ncbi:MAG: GDSL-type esterase/lipase family protein, partial [Candidatus Marinimicrobia bacterium]|nr:GDSL-type esterase/lipase family protein [Candidatus Neomarinimicrobiota bacterium]